MKKKTLTLAQYNKKYKRCLDRLLFYSKEEVKKFDNRHEIFWFGGKSFNNNLDKFLLEGRKFILIDDTYYEIPRRLTFAWFKNINRPVKVLAALVLLAGITYGTLKGFNIINPTTPTYSVSFDCGDGMIGSEHIKTINGKSVIEVAPNPKREGYVFDGWWGKREIVNSEYIYKDKICFPYELKQNTTMYCKWIAEAPKKCTITLKCDDKTYLNPLTVEINSKVSALETPVKQDYKFNYWMYEDKSKVTLPITVTKDLNLTANWTQDAFTVTFHTNGGSQPGGTTYVSESTYSLSHLKSLSFEPVTEKANQTFMGWYTDSGCAAGNEYKFGEAITKDIDLYAKWGKGREYKVTFETNGGSEIKPITCSHISTSPISTRDHYILKGWSTDNSSTDLIDFTQSGGYQVTKDQTLYAIWEQSEFIVELYDGDTLKETKNYVSKIDSKPIYARKDCELVDWYFNKEFTGESVGFPLEINKIPKEKFAENNTLKLYAKYERNAYKVNIYDDDYGSSPTLASSYDSISTLTESYKPSITKPNKSITKFYVRGEGLSELTINFNEKLNDTTIKQYIDTDGVLSIYTHWEISSYNLTLKYPKIEGKTEAITKIVEIKKGETETKVELGDEYNKIDVKDYTFKGWSDKEGGGVEDIIKSITLTEDTTIYAVYVQKTYSLVTQYKCGDTVLKDPITIEHLDSEEHSVNIIPKEEIITKDSVKYGYVKMTIDGTELGNTFTIEKDSICVVEYSKFVNVDLYCKLDNTTESTPYLTLTNQYKIDLSSLQHPTLVDYTFSKYTDEDGNALSGTINASTLKNHKIIVCFTKSSFTVTLNPTGGDIAVDTIEHIKSGSTLSKTLVGEPTKGTMIFDGWYKESECTNKFKFKEDADSDTITGDITLYAKWTGTETKNTTVNFKISDADYEKGARFYNAGVALEQKVITVTKAEVGSMDYGYLNYSGHSLDCWTDETTKAKIAFPLKDEGTHTIVANFSELATYCSLQLDAGEGTFSDKTTKTKLFTPKIGQTFKEFKEEHSSDITTIYDNHTFVCWTLYDITSGSYIEIKDTYTFSSNIFLYAYYVDTIEEKGEKSFNESNWATVSYYANQGLANLKEFYNVSSSTSLVGEAKTVTYNKKSFGVVVIDENQDTLSSDHKTKSALTFSFSEAICLESYGTSTYSSENPTNSWSCAVIRDKLHGVIKEKFDEQLSKNVKKVDKSTMKGGSGTDYGSYVTSSDEFFLFSAYELCISDSNLANYVFTDADDKTKVGHEGTHQYSKYFTSDSKRKMKYDSSYVNYWIRSPYNDEDKDVPGEEEHWHGAKGHLVNSITTDGQMNTSFKLWYPDGSKGIVPGFCLGAGS